MNYLRALMRKQLIECARERQSLAALERELEALIRASARARWLCQSAEAYWREQLESSELRVEWLLLAREQHRETRARLLEAEDAEWNQRQRVESQRDVVRRMDKKREKLGELSERRAAERQTALQNALWLALDEWVVSGGGRRS